MWLMWMMKNVNSVLGSQPRSTTQEVPQERCRLFRDRYGTDMIESHEGTGHLDAGSSPVISR